MLKISKLWPWTLAIFGAWAAFQGAKILRAKRKRDQEVAELEVYFDNLWNRVIFFPDYFPEKEFSNTRELMWYLDQASSTLVVAIFNVNFRMLEDLLIKKASEGVKVRILTDKWGRANSRFRNAGVKTRVCKHELKNPKDPKLNLDLFHHKFMVIDNRAAMLGSLNWTWQGISENRENVCITTSKNIVPKLILAFERLWDLHTIQGCNQQQRHYNLDKYGSSTQGNEE